MTESSDKINKANKVVQQTYGRSIFPFTGPFFCIYAFFWPESFAHWWGTTVGTIIHLIRTIGGV